jgi:hypothetical protein
MRGKKAIVLLDFYSEGSYFKKKRLNRGEVVTVLSDEADDKNKVSVTSTLRYYPIHNVPIEILEIQ